MTLNEFIHRVRSASITRDVVAGSLVQFTGNRGNVYTGRVERVERLHGRMVAKVAYSAHGSVFHYSAGDNELVLVSE